MSKPDSAPMPAARTKLVSPARSVDKPTIRAPSWLTAVARSAIPRNVKLNSQNKAAMSASEAKQRNCKAAAQPALSRRGDHLLAQAGKQEDAEQPDGRGHLSGRQLRHRQGAEHHKLALRNEQDTRHGEHQDDGHGDQRVDG